MAAAMAAALGVAAQPDVSPSIVTRANWQDAPHLRWAYSHIPEILPAATIARGDGLASPLPHAERDLDGLEFTVRGQRHTVGSMLDATDTDGFLVLHHGRILMERYSGATTDSTPHLLQSVSKSMTSGLAGALVGTGRLDPEGFVADYIPELRGSSFDGCRVQDLLNMRAGTRFSEDYTDLDADIRISEQVAGWRPRSLPGLPADLYAYYPTLMNSGPHGGPFDYRSILTDVLGWVLERAGGDSYAALFSRHIWAPLGAEHDADVTVDSGGGAVADGGLCVTLRDLGRFGLMYVGDGEIDGRRVLPREWVARVGAPRPDLVAAFGGVLTYEGVATTTSHYHDQWWVFDADRGIFAGKGIHGQALVIHRPADAVIVKLSTQAEPLDRVKDGLQLAAAVAIGDALEREG
jgi:CubicO group peptidase (beta-lactamase class C family)